MLLNLFLKNIRKTNIHTHSILRTIFGTISGLAFTTRGINGETTEALKVQLHLVKKMPGARLELAQEFNFPTDFKSHGSPRFLERACPPTSPLVSIWCLSETLPEAGLEPAWRFNSPTDFKSVVSAIPPLGHEFLTGFSLFSIAATDQILSSIRTSCRCFGCKCAYRFSAT